MREIQKRKRLQEVLENIPEYLVERLDFPALLHELEQDPSKVTVAEKPRIFHIETTLRCNLSCPFCPRTTDLQAHPEVRDLNAHMDFDNFRRVLDKMPWVKSLELFHYGEPFMQNNFHDFVAECTARGIFSVAASNLLPATPEKVDKVFNAGLGFLVMDIDSLDPEEYAKLRVGGSLELLQKRVQYVLQTVKRPYLVAQCILVEKKKKFTEAQFEAWAGGKPDAYHWKFYDALRGEIIPDKGRLQGICKEPFYGFTVHLDGEVMVCNRDWRGENSMGNIFKQSVEEIWHGPKYQEFRRRMLSEDKPDMCKLCPEGDYCNLRSQPSVQVNMLTGMDV